MKKMFLAVIILIACSGIVAAQNSDSRRGWGYGFGGLGAATDGDGSIMLFHVGGGGEGLFYKGLGAGAEIGYIAPTEDGADGAGLFSTNAAYHFRRSSKWSPFVTGGYSVIFRGFSASGGNFGGGVQYWAGKHIGLRLEVRDHVFSSDLPHFVTFRAGVSFR